jgi:hypothetical protein
MGCATDRATMLVLVVALGIGPWGCAHTMPRAAQPPSDDVRSELGTIGVAAASVAPPAPLMAPTRGKAAGALKGAGGGFVTGAKPGLDLAAAAGGGCIGGGGGQGAATLCALVIMTGLGAAAAGGTVGALGGTVYGLFTADSASTIAAAEDALTRAAADVDVQRSLREHVLRAVGEHGSLTFVDLGERTAADGAPEDHRRWKHDGIDTVLDVTVSQLRLAGGTGVKPRVGVSMAAQARLIRTADGVEVYAETFEYGGAADRTVTGWAADEAAAFRQELDAGTRRLAADIARVLFPSDPVRDDAPQPPAVESLEAPTPP